jgi:hypothetical protein
MDWVKLGFGSEFLDYHPSLPYYIDYSAARPSTESVLTLAKQAIQRIVAKYPAPYTLICSGGVDSQAMALAWKYSGVPFTIVTARYNGGLNDHDLEQLWQLQQREQLPVTSIDLDILNFHEKDLVEWAIKYDCASPHILTHMYICSQVTSGTVISSGNFVTQHGTFGALSYNTFGLHRYAEKSGQSVVPYFWQHDQDLMPAFELLRQLRVSTSDQFNYSYDDKCELFHDAGLYVIPQPEKYTGFEKIKELMDTKPIGYRLKVTATTDAFFRNYDILYRNALIKHCRKMAQPSVTLFDIGLVSPNMLSRLF